MQIPTTTSQLSNSLNSLLNPPQTLSSQNTQSSNNQAAQPKDQISISAAAQALVRSEATEGTSAEAVEPIATQLNEGEKINAKSIDVQA